MNKEKNVFEESLDQFRYLEVREKVRNVYVIISFHVYDHKVLHNIALVFIKFFRFRSDSLAFFARISNFLNFWPQFFKGWIALSTG